MSMTPVVQPHHLSRKAVIYIRQSTGHQVLTNTESQQLQHAMREHARHLGWPEERIEVVETDLGRSAQSTAGRDGSKALLADVALGQVGIVLSYESTRLSRNCTDWYPLLDLCAYNQCLIADRDGVYDAATPNGRLLLGMKGIVSEVELHTLRGRLIAGVQQKAQRGALALALPAGLPRPGAALLQGIVYCGSCGHKMTVQYKGGNQYLCTYLRSQAHAPVCQRLPADPVDQQVVMAFFDALAPAELDLYEQALAQRRQQQAELDQAQRYSVQRLEYAADQARRRYEQVDPAYRLVAAELERRWEAALQALQEAQEHYARLRPVPEDAMARTIPPALREAFSTLGHSLPTLWHQETLSRPQRKALLRCLLEKVVLERRAPDTITTRIVWRGGAVSELEVPCTVGTLRDLTGFAQMEAQVLRLETQGHADEDIAQRLTSQGFRSPQRPCVLESTVRTIRLRHGRLHRYRGPRPRRVPRALTVPQIATAVGVKPHWVDHLISRGRIVVSRDEASGLYLFPDGSETLEAFRQLRDGHITALRYGGVAHASLGRPACTRRLLLAWSPGRVALRSERIMVARHDSKKHMSSDERAQEAYLL